VLTIVKWSDVSPGEGTTSQTPTSLLAQAQADDGDGWQRLVRTYSRRIYRWCRQAGLQPADAGNVVQEVFRAVARKLPDFRREAGGDTFRGWLRRITQNKLRDHFRNQARRPDRAVGGTDAHERILSLRATDPRTNVSGSHASANTKSSACGSELIHRVRAEFSDRDWRFFWRVVVDGQSAVEVGAEFGVTANAVRLVKMRILRRLREEAARTPRGDAS
jgi:RNA polymerase sigma-70 factor (ECF subfamily)